MFLVHFWVLWSSGGTVATQNKQGMKAIIAVSGRAAIGKSASILMLESLLENKKVYEDFHKCDRVLVAKYAPAKDGSKEIFVGCCSEGDPPGFYQQEWIRKCVELGCEIIVTACRTTGRTVENVERIAREGGYKVIYTSVYCNAGDALLLNRLFAENTLKLIDELI